MFSLPSQCTPGMALPPWCISSEPGGRVFSLVVILAFLHFMYSSSFFASLGPGLGDSITVMA